MPRESGGTLTGLREFRDAVDYLRKTARAVQEWQERQLQKHDPQTVLPLLTSERIRRATQLNKAITTDLDAHEVTRETTRIDEFFRAVESLPSALRICSGTVKPGGGWFIREPNPSLIRLPRV